MQSDEDRINVRCPHCGHVFETHTAGDAVGCEDCGETFTRFTNVVETDGEGPEEGADPWCTFCEVDLTPSDPVWMIDGYDGDKFRFPPAFCSKMCASRWGNAATQGDEYKTDRSVIAGFGPDGQDPDVGGGEP